MTVLPTRKYFFGYLFVRLAKTIAICIFLVGVGFVLFRYAQAHNAADAVAYRPSVGLDQRLERLSGSYVRTSTLVAAFNPAAESSKRSAPRFERSVQTDGGFSNLQEQLANIDKDRTRLKQLILDRFEASLSKIEERLRAYAASLRASASATPAMATPPSTPTPALAAIPAATPQEEQETLFSKRLGNREIDSRSTALESAKSFLGNLEAKAESLESRKNLFDSITELDALKKLLPVRIQTSPTPAATPSGGTQSTPDAARAIEARTPAKAEEVAEQLVAYRRSVREAMLSSWGLDDIFEEASEYASTEANKCSSASLLVKGIWLSAFGQMALAAITAALVAFLILVMADLTQTFLDTATNTGLLADAARRDKTRG